MISCLNKKKLYAFNFYINKIFQQKNVLEKHDIIILEGYQSIWGALYPNLSLCIVLHL